MEELIQLFKQITSQTPTKTEKLKGAGSNRQYFRLSNDQFSYVGVIGESKTENKGFVELAKHFSEKGLPTPKVVAYTPDYTFYLQEDLGDLSLFEAIQSGIGLGNFSDTEKNLLFKTIRLLPKMQFDGGKDLDYSVCYPLPELDKQTVLWDLNYFKYSFLKTTGVNFFEPALENDFQQLADDLLQSDTETFLYRDFQSRNVMIKDGEPFFIDFQGGRKGPIFYDVASFVWQAKASYPADLKEELIAAYLDAASQYIPIDKTEFYKQLDLFVFFRTLQVLGTYGFRGYFERKSHFLESIPFAIKNLKSLLIEKNFSSYPELTKVLTEMATLDRFQIIEKSANNNLLVTIYSFSYKKGIPEDVSGNGGGYVFDCRSVHNPGRYEQYKNLTGLDQPVIDFLEKDGEIFDFLNSVYALADAHVRRYLERGFTNLMFNFGCTGGQHRSVYSAQHLAEYINKKYAVKVLLKHREQGIEQAFE